MEYKALCVLVLVFALALGTWAQDQTVTCTIAPRERQNCGYPGVTPSECKSKGCCFDDTVPRVPWCFQPALVNTPEDEECPF
ncbi:trefoil factor 1 [Tupaia chinensis]|uniref:trefoil factor 1 n=1 Tax=Tupaia chinensis TaxID=246437 RepID=UPI0003C8FCC1|nr:trefoil factor 1 [Tupaia chinensis]